MNLDITGSDPRNRRSSAIPINYNGGDVAILAPQDGFFHTSNRSPVLKYRGEKLDYGKDYRYIYKSKEIRAKYKISAHAAIELLRPDLKGQIDFEASFLGSIYQLYGTNYIADITSVEYLLSLYDINSLTDLPEELPPKASILDAEKIKSGAISSVQVIYSVGLYLKNYEVGVEPPSNGIWWPELPIDDRPPPLNYNIEIDAGGLTPIPSDNLAQPRFGMIPLGSMPLGRGIKEP